MSINTVFYTNWSLSVNGCNPSFFVFSNCFLCLILFGKIKGKNKKNTQKSSLCAQRLISVILLISDNVKYYNFFFTLQLLIGLQCHDLLLQILKLLNILLWKVSDFLHKGIICGIRHHMYHSIFVQNIFWAVFGHYNLKLFWKVKNSLKTS